MFCFGVFFFHKLGTSKTRSGPDRLAPERVQPEFWPQAESPAREPSLLWKLEVFIPILCCLDMASPLYRGLRVGEMYPLPAPDFKLGHVTCLANGCEVNRGPKCASTAELAPRTQPLGEHVPGGCCPFSRGARKGQSSETGPAAWSRAS